MGWIQAAAMLRMGLRAALDSHEIGEDPARAAQAAAEAALASMASDRRSAALKNAGMKQAGDTASRQNAADGGIASAMQQMRSMESPVDEIVRKIRDAASKAVADGEQGANRPASNLKGGK